MNRLLGLLLLPLQRIFRININLVRSTVRKRTDHIKATMLIVALVVPIFGTIAYMMQEPLWHMAIAIAAAAGMIYIRQCYNVMAGLALLELEFAKSGVSLFNGALNRIQGGLQLTKDAVDEILARLDHILYKETDDADIENVISELAHLAGKILKLAPQALNQLLGEVGGLTKNLEKYLDGLPESVVTKAKARFQKEFDWARNVLWYALFLGFVGSNWPWWDNPPAFAGAIFWFALCLLIPEERKASTSTTTATPEFAPPWWVKWPAIAGVIGWIYTWYESNIPLDFAAFMDNKALLLFTGMILVPGLIMAAMHLKPRRTLSYAGALVYTLAVVWTGHGQSIPRYLRVTHVSGIAICDRFDANTGAIAVENSLWHRVGKSVFIERQPKEMLDDGTELIFLSNRAEKDPAGNLWILVAVIDPEGNLVSTVKPGYIPYRGNYVIAMGPPGGPVEFSDNPSFDPEAGRTRICESNTRGLIEFGRKKFGREFQLTTWLGFKPVPDSVYADPLDVKFEVGNGYETSLSSGQEYLGVDFFCDASQLEVPVKAAADGEIDGVTLNSYLSVTICHAGSVWTHYGHLSKIASTLQSGSLHTGRSVKQGEIIGYIARGRKHDVNGGKATLYFVCIRRQGNGFVNPVDPLPILGRAEYPPIPWEIQKASYTEKDEEVTTN